MDNKNDTGVGPEARALASQKIFIALLNRLQKLDPQCRVFAAQALEDAATSLERQAREETDVAELRLLRSALEVVEHVRDTALGCTVNDSRRPH